MRVEQGGGLKVTKREFCNLSVGLKAAYPRFQFLSTDAEMEFWYRMLQDYDYRIAENAAMEHISTSAFPPSIADLRKLCTDRCTKGIPSFEEAWGTVQKAISSYGRENPEKAYAMMDEMTRTVVKNLGWTNLCVSEKPEADRANFRMAYEERAKAEQSSRQIPKFVEQQKQILMEQHMPERKTIEQIQQTRISATEAMHDVRDGMTPEELADRGKRFAEMRRRIFGG